MPLDGVERMAKDFLERFTRERERKIENQTNFLTFEKQSETQVCIKREGVE